MFNEINNYFTNTIDAFVENSKQESTQASIDKHENFVKETYSKFKKDLERVVLIEENIDKDNKKTINKIITFIETKLELEYFEVNGKETFVLNIIPNPNDDINMLVLRSQWRGTIETTQKVVDFIKQKTEYDKTIVGNKIHSVGTTGKPVFDNKENKIVKNYHFEPTDMDLKFFNAIGRFKW